MRFIFDVEMLLRLEMLNTEVFDNAGKSTVAKAAYNSLTHNQHFCYVI